MHIYSVTVSIDPSVHQQWIQWMTTIHIPEVLATGFFEECKICKVVTDDENNHPTYCFQYLTKSLENLTIYQRDYSPALQKDHRDRYEGKFSAQRHVYEVISVL